MKFFLLYIVLSFLAINLYAQKVEVDQRAFNYYSAAQIQQMPNSKIKQINYLYQKSFIIPKGFEDVINPNDIDIRDYSKYRLPDQRAKVTVIDKDIPSESNRGESRYILLISINELKQAYKNLK